MIESVGIQLELWPADVKYRIVGDPVAGFLQGLSITPIVGCCARSQLERPILRRIGLPDGGLAVRPSTLGVLGRSMSVVNNFPGVSMCPTAYE
jgi:hypothetical protein